MKNKTLKFEDLFVTIKDLSVNIPGQPLPDLCLSFTIRLWCIIKLLIRSKPQVCLEIPSESLLHN